MGHEVIRCGTKSEVINDADLWLIRHFALDALGSEALAGDDPAREELRQYFEEWAWLGPGVYLNLDLSDRLDPAWNDTLRKLLEEMRNRILRFGENIPSSYLTEQLSPSVVTRWPAILPTKVLLSAIAQFGRVALS
jgi:hypothetical protein